MLHIRQRTAQPHSWHTSRHQETPKSMRASGTSGPLPHVATEARMGIRQELLDPLLHVTTEPSSSLQQKPTKDLTHGVILFRHQIRRNEQTVSVGAVYVSLTPIQRKAYFFHFSKFKNFLDIKKERNYRKKKTNHKKKLRVKIVLNNKEDPMHDSTNTCSCDCGVRETVQSIVLVSGCVYRVMGS